jgi:predicted DNA-binding transcriptional regulator AlpA
LKTHRAKSTCKSQPKENENKSIYETLAAYLRMKDLLVYLSLSESTIWRGVRTGSFPKPVKLSESVTAWRTADIRDWMQKIEGNTASITTAVNS